MTEKLCKCGHEKIDHNLKNGYCSIEFTDTIDDITEDMIRCDCGGWKENV